MTIVIARLLNLRYVGARRLRTLLTVAGIASGVALVFSISVINTTLIESFRLGLRVVGGEAEIEVASAGPAGLDRRLESEIEAVDGVAAAVPVVRTRTTLRSSQGAEEMEILGVTPEFPALFPREGPLGEVAFEGGIGTGGIAIASEVADRLGAVTGDDVAIETPSGVQTITITGVMTGGPLRAVNAGAVGVMGLGDAQARFDRAGRIDSLYVVTDPEAAIDEVTSAIEERTGPEAVVGPPGERGKGLERVFGGIGTLLSLTGTVSLFVALFVVFNTMSMAVAERRRDLSMALATGASPRGLFTAFLAEAAVIGVIASSVGLLLGRAIAGSLVQIAAEGYSVLPISTGGPAIVQLSHVAGAFTGGVVVSVAGAFVPARRVLKMAPVEALRPVASYESQVALGGRRLVTAGFAAIILALPILWAFLVTGWRWVATSGLVVGLTGITLMLPAVVPAALSVLRRMAVPVLKTEGRLAVDTLAKNPGRTTFTSAALVLTLGLVLGVASALASFRSQVVDMAGALLGAPVYVTAASFEGLSSDQPLDLSFRDDLAQVEGVGFVYPIRFAYVTVGGDQVVMYGIPGKDALAHGMTTEAGSIVADPDAFHEGLERGGIAVSDLMARRRGLEVGDTLTLPTARGDAAFPIVALFQDLVSLDSIYMDYDVYRREWRDDKVDEFGILLQPGAEADDVRLRLQELIEETGSPATVLTKEDLISQLIELVEGTFSLGRAIQFAALIVALLTIANTMFTSVLERRWEIGLQRAVGMSSGQISRGILVEAVFLGAVGAVGGIVVGTASGWLMTRAMEVQFEWNIGFDPPVVAALGMAAVGIVVAALAGVVPSRMAIRPSIVESLRFE